MPIFELSLLGVRIAPTYYGTAYAVGFLLGYLILKKRSVVPSAKLDDLLFYVFLGVFLWGRLGYVFFYDLSYYLAHPLEIPQTWKGGMSFHGGVVGVIAAMWAYSKKMKESFLTTADEVTLILPIGIMLWRIANYVNGELFGFGPYSWPLAMTVDGVGRFPSPLLEATLEWPALFALLWFVSKRKPNPGTVATTFLWGYAVFRIFAEFFRTPDAQIGYLYGFVTMGQTLSAIMFAAAVTIFFTLKNHAPEKLQ